MSTLEKPPLKGFLSGGYSPVPILRPATPLLQAYPGAAAAYSLQDIDGSGGKVVRARRSTDNAEMDFTAKGVKKGKLRHFALNNDSDIIRFADQAAAADKRMYFNGVNKYVTFGNQSSIGIAQAFSLTVDIVTSDDITSQQQIFDSSNSALDRFALCVRSGEIRVAFYDTAYRYAKSYSGISANTKYSITFAYDGAGGSTLTVNGNASDGVNSPVNLALTGLSYVGVQTTSQPFKGLIYNLAVYSDAAFTTKVWEVNGYGNTNGDWEDQIGANNGTVNGSPALFSGQGFNAYVPTLYDLSGNGRNATQPTAASQPQIVANGVVVTDTTGVPSLDFDGTDDAMTPPNLGALSAFYVSVVASCTNGGGSFKGLYSPSTNGGSLMVLARSSTGSTWGTFGGGIRAANSDLTSISIVTMTSPNGASGSFFKDGAADGTFAGTDGQTPPHIGGVTGQYIDGKISEIVYYETDQSPNRAAIESNIAARYGIALP